MLEIKNLKISERDHILLEHFHLTLQSGDKLAIIGEEGNGKTTLLKAIAGVCDYATVTGEIKFTGTIGYLSQMIPKEIEQMSVKDYLFEQQNPSTIILKQINQLIIKWHLPPHFLELSPLFSLSGGEKVKLQLLKIVIQKPSILLLDEPSNDLDLDTLIWLEGFINETDVPILYVSHDEILLEHTANRILHLEQTKRKTEMHYTLVSIGYQDYVERRFSNIQKTTQIARKEKAEANQKQEKLNQIMNRVAHEQATISRSNPHGAKMLKRKMKTVKVQERKLKETKLTEIPDYEEAIQFFFSDVTLPKGRQVLAYDQCQLLTPTGQLLSKDIHLNVMGSDHIGIIGRNGCGKTTLLKEISQIRSRLGNMKFTEEEMLHTIACLSGGSKAKLLLLKLMLDGCDVLLLDEPTRNLSPLTGPVIRLSLAQFKGTIISISHDRKYLKEVCQTIYELTPYGLVLTTIPD